MATPKRTRARKPKLGTGKRFRTLKRRLAKRGARTAGALAAYIGRKKFGKKPFAKLGAAGRKRAAKKRKSPAKRKRIVGPPKTGMRTVKGRGGKRVTIRRPRPRHA